MLLKATNESDHLPNLDIVYIKILIKTDKIWQLDVMKDFKN